MSATTLCPTCNTRFKITQEQLEVHRGLVRCGRCQAVFNATEYLQDDQPSPQLDVPIEAEKIPAVEKISVVEQASVEEIPNEPPISVEPEPVPSTFETLDFSLPVPLHPEAQIPGQQNTEQRDKEQLPIDPQENIQATELITLAQKITLVENPQPSSPEPLEKKNTWPWLVGSLLLLFVLLAQAAYFFRIELAANFPGLKPALTSYCKLLLCSVPLPQKADLMSIESSELSADPAQATVITLNALLRNHASYAQGFPNLELTLTDAQEKPLARRTFRPLEYLKSGEEEKQGLAANHEFSVKLNLDTTDLKPSGYRLLLFYPQ